MYIYMHTYIHHIFSYVLASHRQYLRFPIYLEQICVLLRHTLQNSRLRFNFSLVAEIICAPLCCVRSKKAFPRPELSGKRCGSKSELGRGITQPRQGSFPGPWLIRCLSTHCTNTLDQRMRRIKSEPVLPKAKVYLAELTNQASTHIKASVRLQPMVPMETLQSRWSGIISELKSLTGSAGSAQDQFKYFCNYSTINS